MTLHASVGGACVGLDQSARAVFSTLHVWVVPDEANVIVGSRVLPIT